MRIASTILGVLVWAMMALQSCALYATSGLSSDPNQATNGAVGLVVTFLAMLGLAFVWGAPRLATILYVLAAVLAFMVGTTGFSDMRIWGLVLLGLAFMAFLGWRETRRKTVRVV